MGTPTVAARLDAGKDGGKLRARWAAALLLAALLAPVPAAAQLPPDESWRTLDTERFRVTYPERLEALARRAGARAERAFDELTGALSEVPRGRIDLVLTDNLDVSNGFASVAPRRRIVVFARPPVDGLGLAYFDDWLELVITHELAHVFHLERTSRFGHLLRSVFGRVPGAWPFFPENGVPRWVVEGTATYYESALTESGRTEGSYHEMVLRTAALENQLDPIDRASGESPDWPGGDRAYVYGSGFFAWLLERHGSAKMGDFIEAIAGQWIPYRLNSAAKHAFGASFSAEWKVWSAERRAAASALSAELAARAPLTVTEPITRGARYVLSPSVSPDGRTLAFGRSDGLTDAQIRVASPDGADSRQLARSNGVPLLSWTADGALITAQFEQDGPYRFRSDLYRVDPSGATTRLTRNARLEHPSAARDGRTAVAIRDVDGTTQLVRVDLASGAVTELTPAEPDVHWAFPALSPAGARIAVTRWRAGRSFDLVLLDAEGRLLQEITDDRAVEFAPAWSADGRWLLWTSDRTGIPNLFAAGVDGTGRAGAVRQVTNMLTGIAYPSVDPAGRWIYGAVYHADGWEVERLAFDPARWMEPFPLAPSYGPVTPEPAPPPAGGPSRPYSPARTLVPGFWELLAQPAQSVFIEGRGDVELLAPAYGLATFATDLVGRHSWQLAAVVATDGRVEGGFSYGYQGLGNPHLSLTAQQDWDASGPRIGRRRSGAIDTLFLRKRERMVSLGTTALLRRYRMAGSLGVAAGLVQESSELLDRDLRPSALYRLDNPSSRLAHGRASASLSTARGHALSVSADEGAALSLVGRVRRQLDLADSLRAVAGSDRSYADGIGVLRLFQPLRAIGLDRHVIALRAAGGTATGPGADRFHFDVGGASGYAFPLRGYRNGARSGRVAWASAAEYRFPIVRVNRGIGLIPIHLDQVSGGLFADAGNAWGPEPARPATLASVGAELSADLLALFNFGIPLRGGVAIPLMDVPGQARSTPVYYLRLGTSF